MNLDQLEALEAAARLGSFHAAGRELHLSQPAISAAIKKLEEELGFLLFDRSTYRPQLTPGGSAFLHKAKEMLHQKGELQSLARHLATGREKELNLSVDNAFSLQELLPILAEFRQKHPHTLLNLTVENLGGSLEQLTDGLADLMIGPLFEAQEHLITQSLRKVQMIPVIAKKHPLVAEGGMISEESLRQAIQVVVRDSARHSPKLSFGLLPGAPQWIVSSFEVKQMIIQAGLGWGTMPEHLVEKEIKKGVLLLLRTGRIKPRVGEFSLARKKEAPLGPVAQDFWNM